MAIFSFGWKARLLSILAIIGISIAPAQAGEINITIANIPNATSRIFIALYHSAASMSENKAAITKIVEATGNPMVIPLGTVGAGTYAFVAFADENSNGKLDTNLLGIPVERYGFSNNVMGLFGPPGFSEASLQVGKEPTSFEIKLR